MCVTPGRLRSIIGAGSPTMIHSSVERQANLMLWVEAAGYADRAGDSM
jgi:hypothetical protein